MNIITTVQVTKKELKALKIIKNKFKGSYNHSGIYDEFRKEYNVELGDLKMGKTLLRYVNHGPDSYISYELTELAYVLLKTGQSMNENPLYELEVTVNGIINKDDE